MPVGSCVHLVTRRQALLPEMNGKSTREAAFRLGKSSNVNVGRARRWPTWHPSRCARPSARRSITQWATAVCRRRRTPTFFPL